jgi:peptide/nickel transport system substrate-binding protein
VYRQMCAMGGAGLLMVGLAGCGSQTSSTVAEPQSVVVALAADTSPNWFFPIGSTTTFTLTNYEVNTLAYLPLIALTANNQIDYAQSLASKVTWNRSATQFTVTLNPKVHWSDGRPLTARDVVFTWDIIKWGSSNLKKLPWAYGGAGSGGVPSDWKSVTAVGARKIVITLTRAVNQQWFIRNGLGQIIPAPAFVWDRYPNSPIKEMKFIESVANTPTSSLYHVVDGPYRFQSYTPNGEWVYTANPDFWGQKARIKKVIFAYETSPESEFTGLKSGTVDVGYFPMSLWTSRKKLTHDVVWSNYVWGASFIQINFHPTAPLGTVMQNLYVRQALQDGIDQPGIIKTLLHGQGITLNGPVPSKPKTSYFDPALAKSFYPYNPSTGKHLLEVNGWRLVNGVMTNSAGQRLAFTFQYPTGSATDTDIAQVLKSAWASEGIQVTLKPMEINQMLAETPSQWTMYWLGLSTWQYVPDYYPNGGALFTPTSPLNTGGYNNTVMTAKIEKGYNPEPSTKAALLTLYQYETFAAKQLPVLYMPYAAGLYAHIKELDGPRRTQNLVSSMLYPNLWSYHS